jgi:ABC-type uncharacterized transport system permease subunit
MSLHTLGTLTIVFYLAAFVGQILQLRRRAEQNNLSVILISSLAIGLNAYLSWRVIMPEGGFDFSLWRSSTAIFCIINLVVLLSSLRKPALNLTLFLFPFSIPPIVMAITGDSTADFRSGLSLGVGIHILSSIMAYSLLTIAALQSVMLAYQNWQLRHKHFKGISKTLPPLETMESLLFTILWIGVALLTASLISGLIVFDDLFAQQLVHKTVFSISAWLIYSTLLWGRHYKGWRGNVAIRWTLYGFTATVLAYWGSKFVLEILIQN